jgi:hypothetical protein
MKFDEVVSCLPAIVKNATPEVTDRFQDGRRRHVGNSSECYKMGNYHPILMKIGTLRKTLRKTCSVSSEITINIRK